MLPTRGRQQNKEKDTPNMMQKEREMKRNRCDNETGMKKTKRSRDEDTEREEREEEIER